MTDIENLNVIKDSQVGNKTYFIDLLSEGYACGILSDSDVERIQQECFILLQYNIERYNSDHSSSVRIEKAQEFFSSITYVIGLQLKKYCNSDMAVKILKDKKIEDLYYKGIKRANLLKKTSIIIYSKLIQELFPINNKIYKCTIGKQIKENIKKYNSELYADQIPIFFDYPLVQPINNLVGIEYIHEYIKSIYTENSFCAKFDIKNISNLLYLYNEDYTELTFNIFEQVLIAAIGCSLSERDIKELALSPDDLLKIKLSLHSKEINDITNILNNCYLQIENDLNITDQSLSKYIKTSLISVARGIHNADRLNMLDKYFVVSDIDINKFNILFKSNDKMSDNEYLRLLDQIEYTNDSEKRLTLIKEKAKSFQDLFNILKHAALSKKEIVNLLYSMDIMTIVALMKKITSDDMVVSSQESLLLECFQNTIDSFDEKQKSLYSKLMKIIHFEE